MRKSQNQCKHDYDRRVPESLVLTPNDYVFINNPPLRSSADSSAEPMSKKVYNKLQPRTAGPSRFTLVQEKTLMIDEHGKPLTVLIDRVTHIPKPASADRHQSHEQLRIEILLKQEPSQKDAPQKRDSVVYRIFRRIDAGPQTKYIVG